MSLWGYNMINRNESRNTVGKTISNVRLPLTVQIMHESLIQIVWNKRLIVLVTTLATLIAVLVYLIKSTPIYTSTSKIYVEQSGPKIISETEEGIMTQSKNYLYTQAELLKSMPILTSVVDNPGAKKMQTFAKIDNPILFMKRILDVHVGDKDDIISISFKSPYPAESAQIVNSVVDAYIKYHASRKRSTSAEVLKILQNEKDKRNNELSEKLKAMMDFKRENVSLAFETDQGNIVIERLGRLSTVLTEAQLATIESKSAYESAKAMISDPAGLAQFIEAQRARGVYVSSISERGELMSKLDQLQLRLQDRLRQVTHEHPAITSLEGEIAHIKSQIEQVDTDFAQSQIAVLEQQYLAAKEKEDQVTRYYEDQRQLALDLNEQLAQYTILQSDWEQTKKLCDILDDRIKEINVTEDAGALNISILEYARVENKPSEPQKARFIGIALIIGLMLGVALALLRDWMDQTLRSTEEVSSILGVPVLGVVPSMYGEKSIITRGRKVHFEPNSPAAEAYRAIRTSVFFGVPDGKAKTILITSPEPLEGKTTLASNLAITMAQAGQKTLLLDADFRNPMQYQVFEMNNVNGLVSLLSGTTTLERAIHASGIDGLELLPCKTQLVNSAEIISSKSFAKLIKEVSDRYDRVIIDSPPVLPVTDAQILAAISDVTLLVLRADKSTRKSSRQARDGLLSVGAHLLGVVVNNASKKGRYGYYSGYKYYRGNEVFKSHTQKKITNNKSTTVAKGPDITERT
jgi:succinoglycan biosynthesis transport protein ExoP